MILLSFLSSILFLGQSDTTKITKSYNLDEIVVTASRIPKALKDVPVVTRVIGHEVIKRNSGQTLISLLEKEVPGIEFTQTEGVTNNITFQGMGANYILILVDGERIAGETSRSNPDFNRINLENIERIEIVKGSMSTLYGSGAIAGVINIITKSSNKPFTATAGINYSSEGESKYSISAGGVSGKFGVEGNLVKRDKNRYFIDDYTTGVPVAFEVEGYDNFSSDIKFSFKESKFKSSLKGSYYTHERFNAGNLPTHDSYNDANIVFKSQYNLNQKNYFELSYNYDNYKKYDLNTSLNEREMNYLNEINNLRLNYFTLGIKNHSITTGFEFFGERLLTYQFMSGKTESANSLSAYLQDDYKINDKMGVQWGVRSEGHSEFGINLTPKISAMYKTGKFTFRTGYAGGFRSPSLKELFTKWSHMNIFNLVGNKDLKPETSNNYSLSAEFNSNKLNLSANLYHNRIKDKISTVWNNTMDTVFYKNIDKAEVTGADFNAKAEVTNSIIVRGYYSFVKDINKSGGYNESSVRPHSAVLGLEYGFTFLKGDYSININSRYSSGVSYYTMNSRTYEYSMVRNNPFTIVNCGIRGSIYPGLSIYTGVNNILNYKPKEISFNSYFTKGTSIFINLTLNIESILKPNR